MTPQSSVNLPKTHLKTAQNSAKQYKKRVLRAVFALLPASFDLFFDFVLPRHLPVLLVTQQDLGEGPQWNAARRRPRCEHLLTTLRPVITSNLSEEV